MLDSDRGSGRQKIHLKTPGLVHIIESKATQRGMRALPWSCGWRPELGPARGGAHPDRHPARPHPTSPVSAGAWVLRRIRRVPETPGPRPQLGWWVGRPVCSLGAAGDTGPPSTRTSSQKLSAGSGSSQDPTREPRGGGRRPGSGTRRSTFPTGPRTLTASGGEWLLVLAGVEWGGRLGPPSQPQGVSPPSLCSLSIGGDGGAFEQQVAGAVLDLMGDEAQSLSRGRQQLKW